MSKKAIKTNQAPAAIGPYSQGVVIGNLLYTSGQIPIDVATGEIPESIEEQAALVLRNLAAIATEAGATLNDVVKTTVFVKDLGQFGTINEIYASFFEEPYPSRSTVEVARLPKDVLIEIEAIIQLP